MRRKSSIILIGAMLLSGLVAGCVQGPDTPDPTLLPESTITPTNAPTLTDAPTETPTPTDTPTPEPSDTPIPTETPSATPDSDITTEIESVWYCEQQGDGSYQWYEVKVTYYQGTPIAETVLSGPYSGGWQPNCPGITTPIPLDESPSENESSEGWDNSSSGNGDNDNGGDDEATDPPPLPPPPGPD